MSVVPAADELCRMAQTAYDRGFTIIPTQPASQGKKIVHGYRHTDVSREKGYTWTMSNIQQGGQYAIRADDIVIVDVDAKPKNESKAEVPMYEFANKIRDIDTFQQSSQSGNPHAFFLRDERMEHWTKKEVLGFVDVMVGTNAFVIGAGSTIEGGGIYTIYKDVAISRMPDWLFETLNTKMTASTTRMETISSLFEKPPRVLTPSEREFAKNIIMHCLSEERANTYDSWLKVGVLCFNLFDAEGLDIWNEWSIKGVTYVPGCCESKWRTFRKGNLGMGTLRYWAKMDNQAQYEALVQQDVNALIDRCIGSDGAHSDVSDVMFALFKDSIVYVDEKLWYYCDPKTGLWKADKGGLYFTYMLNTELCKKFLDRSMYWSCEAIRVGGDHRETMEERSTKLKQIGKQLKQAGYCKQIRELSAFQFRQEDFLDRINANPKLTAFTNGVYDADLGKLRPIIPDDYIQWQIPYDLPETCSSVVKAKWKQYIGKIFPNETMQHVIESLIADGLDGTIPQESHNFFIHGGVGGNGKSDLIGDIVRNLYGDYFLEGRIEMLTQKRGAAESASPAMLMMRNKRFIMMTEPEDDSQLNGGLLKQLSGGDSISARDLYAGTRDLKTFRLYGFIHILCQPEAVDIKANDGGMLRRIKVLQYNSRFVENEDEVDESQHAYRADKTLNVELKAHLGELMRYFIDVRAEKGRIIPNNVDEIKVATRAFINDCDTLQQFVDEHFMREATGYVQLAEVRSLYQGWAQRSNVKALALKQLKAGLEKIMGKVYEAKKLNGKCVRNVFSGWKMRVEDDDSDAEY